MTAGLPRYRVRLLHLTAIWAYGVTQPVLALVDGNPDLVITRGASRLDLVLFAALVAVSFPILAIAYCWLAGRMSRWVGDMLYLAALAACIAPLAARGVKIIEPGLVVAIALVVFLSGAGVVLYARLRPVRLFASYSIVLPLVAAASFLHGMPTLAEDAKAATGVEIRSPVPVVMIVLDELPVSSLLTPSGEIDAVRYPAFARLARDGTWYPNATTVHEWTSDAVPSLVTGQVGDASSLPIARNHPESLFSLLGESYELVVHESWTQLCPERYCPREREPLAEIVHGLALDTARLVVPRILPDSFATRIVRVNDDIALEDVASVSLERCDSSLDEATAAAARDVLFYCHLLLPHAPWTFLPSGARYDWAGIDGWLPTEHWEDEPWSVLQGFQRHLLQLGYTDRVLDGILGRLDRSGLYDRALVVLVADHGVSFRPGEGRRPVTDGNFADIASVPLFVKLPEQQSGRVDERAARTIDVLPTIADVLDVTLPWTVDGTSLLGPADAEQEVLVDLRGGAVARGSLGALARERETVVRWKSANFGEGHDSLYHLGTNRQLLGRNVALLERHPTDVTATIENAEDLTNVHRSSGFVPARIFARVRRGAIDPDTELAVAVNGRVEALTRVFTSDGRQLFRAMVPEASLRDGANTVEVFLIRGTGERVSLAPIASTRD